MSCGYFNDRPVLLTTPANYEPQPIRRLDNVRVYLENQPHRIFERLPLPAVPATYRELQASEISALITQRLLRKGEKL